MKFKILAIVLLAGFISVDSNAGFEQFNDPVGSMNVFDNISGSQGGWLWNSAWGLADVQSITTDNRTFELLPNINNYGDGTDPYWSDGSGDGNKWLEALTLYEISPLTGAEQSVTFSFTVDAYDLDSRYSLIGFVKVLDPLSGYATVAIDPVTITTTGSHTLSISTSGLGGMLLQAGWALSGINANPVDDWGSVTVTATALDADTGDTDAPTPDPMTFAIAPAAISDQAISMTATTATDDSAVEYFFTCTLGGGNNSGWQSSTTYVDTGLAASTEYTYTVTARDLSTAQNTTVASDPASATTIPTDNTLPSPSPMTFSATPIASPVSVSMTATTATDDSAVEYYFTSISGGGNDSGWQSSPTYVDGGLSNETAYTYTVIARDLSAATNTTASSAAVMVTTTSPILWMVNSVTNYTGDSTQDSTSFALALDSLEITSNSATRVVGFDGSGATFGEAFDFTGRNVLRTLGQNYGDSSFEASVTIDLDGTGDQAAYIGMGQGLVGSFGVPDLALLGVNAVNAELQAHQTKMWRHENGVAGDEHLTTVATAIGTHRLNLAYDADAETATITIDTNYTGGVFSADRTIGTVSTTNLWVGAPVRVYVGGGQGLVFRDLMIKSTDHVVDDLSIAGPIAGGGMVFSWDGSAGQIYDVQYKTDLVISPTWTTDPSPGCSDIFAAANGTISATSTVSSAEVFYQVVPK